jgi:GT2 family glycosyltransferase
VVLGGLLARHRPFHPNVNQGTAVTIAIPTYNQAPFIRQAVESALRQSATCKILVSDDCSTDGTPQILEQLASAYPEISVIRPPKNLGIGAHHRWLLDQIDTPFFVKLDSDDVLEPRFVQALLTAMLQYPEAGLAHAEAREVDQDGRTLRLRRLAPRPTFCSATDNLRKLASGYNVAANIVLLRTDAYRKAGGYNPQLRFAEDWDLAVRLAAQGFGDIHLSEVLSSYRVWTGSSRPRFARKLDEIRGVRQVLQETLRDAYEQRGWSVRFLDAECRRRAWNLSLELDAYPVEERTQLLEALAQLGDSALLRAYARLAPLGWGRLRRATARMRLAVRDRVKGALHGLRPNR